MRSLFPQGSIRTRCGQRETSVPSLLRRMISEQEGQVIVECGLLLGFLGIGIVALLAVVGTDLQAVFKEGKKILKSLSQNIKKGK